MFAWVQFYAMGEMIWASIHKCEAMTNETACSYCIWNIFQSSMLHLFCDLSCIYFTLYAAVLANKDECMRSPELCAPQNLEAMQMQAANKESAGSCGSECVIAYVASACDKLKCSTLWMFSYNVEHCTKKLTKASTAVICGSSWMSTFNSAKICVLVDVELGDALDKHALVQTQL